MRDIPIGTKGTDTLLVKPEHTANQFKDAILPQVFATPMMVLLMENAALNAIRPYLEPGESAVGTAIDMQHLAATPVGHQVTAQAEVTKVEGRQIDFGCRRATKKKKSAAARIAGWRSTSADSINVSL